MDVWIIHGICGNDRGVVIGVGATEDEARRLAAEYATREGITLDWWDAYYAEVFSDKFTDVINLHIEQVKTGVLL